MEASLLDIALFRLADKGVISLEESRILKTVRKMRVCSLHSLCSETGLDNNYLAPALRALKEKGLLSELSGLYFSDNFDEKIVSLIGYGETELIGVRM